MNDFRPCIVIPYFNHPHTIEATLAGLEALQVPCWVADDGSDPAGAQAAASAVRSHREWVTLLRSEQNEGKGAAVLRACSAAQQQGFTHALQVDADGQHTLADAPMFIALSRGSPQAVILGLPIYDDSVPRSRLYGRLLTHVWVWINTLSRSIRDSMCGFRVYPLAPLLAIAAEERPGLRMQFDTEVAVRLFWRGVPVIQLPTKVIYPPSGISHFDLWRDNVRITAMHTRLFFGMLRRLPRLLARK